MDRKIGGGVVDVDDWKNSNYRMVLGEDALRICINYDHN